MSEGFERWRKRGGRGLGGREGKEGRSLLFFVLIHFGCPLSRLLTFVVFALCPLLSTFRKANSTEMCHMEAEITRMKATQHDEAKIVEQRHADAIAWCAFSFQGWSSSPLAGWKSGRRVLLRITHTFSLSLYPPLSLFSSH